MFQSRPSGHTHEYKRNFCLEGDDNHKIGLPSIKYKVQVGSAGLRGRVQ